MIENTKELIKVLESIRVDTEFMEAAKKIAQPISYSNSYKVEMNDLDAWQRHTESIFKIEESGHLIFDSNSLLNQDLKIILQKNNFNLSASGTSAMLHLDDDVWLRIEQ